MKWGNPPVHLISLFFYRDHVYTRSGGTHRGGLPSQLGWVTRLGGVRFCNYVLT